MALRAVPDHPKFARLKAYLGQPKGAVMGWLEAVWHFTGRFTPQGNIGKYTNQTIEAWVEWNGEPGFLIDGLIETGWIDVDTRHRLLIHDWAEHADKATKNALGRAKTPFCTPTVHTPYVDSTYEKPESGNTYRLPEPEPVPEPVPEPEAAQAPPSDRSELMFANWLLEEAGVIADNSTRRMVADSIRLLAREGGTTQSAAEFILHAARDALAEGETVNRFWFSDQRYRPQKPKKGTNRKQLEQERVEATRRLEEQERDAR